MSAKCWLACEVREFLVPQAEVPSLHPGDGLAQVIERLSESAFPSLPVTDANGHYLGMVSLEEVHMASRLPVLDALVVAADLMRADVRPLAPKDRLDRALELFVESDGQVLAVVDGGGEQRVIGIIRRVDIASAYLRRVHGRAVPEVQ